MRVKCTLNISLWISQNWKCPTGICKYESEIWRKLMDRDLVLEISSIWEVVKVLRVDDSQKRSSTEKKKQWTENGTQKLQNLEER